MFDHLALCASLDGVVDGARYVVMGRDAFAAYHGHTGSPNPPMHQLPFVVIYNRDVPPHEVRVYDVAWRLLKTLTIEDS